MPHDIIDNSEIKLIEVLKQKLSISKKAKFAVGWLFLSGFKELKNEIDKLEKLEILAGSRIDRRTAELLFLEKKRQKIVKEILENKKYLPDYKRNLILEEEYKELINDLSYIEPTAENIDFIKWFLKKLDEGKIDIRIYYKEPLHAKLYLFEYKDSKYGLGEAIIGSSNLSLSGLSLNTELNVRTLGDENFKKLTEWFNKRWEESELTEFSILAKEAIKKSWAFNEEVTPFRIYLKVLNEIFAYKEEEKKPEIEAELLDFQRDAVIDAYLKLNKFNGVFIADDPGLGKTYIGSALLAHLETEGKFSIVIAPPRLKEYWEDVLKNFGVTRTKVYSSGKLEDVLNDEKIMKRSSVVLIDESHHFRNFDTKKYKDITNICYQKQVVLLSATPQNLSIWDIYYQLKLFTPYESSHKFRIYPIELKKFFEACEQGKANIEDLISQIFIRRTRSDIKEYYSNTKIVFPKRNGPYRVDYSIDEVYEGGLYSKLQESINKLKYARYDLSRYTKAGEFELEEIEQLNRAWTNLKDLIKINLYRRLESSVSAFKDTIETYLKATEGFIKIIEKEKKVPIANLYDLNDMIESIKNDEEIEWHSGENYYEISKFNLEDLINDLNYDLKIYKEMHDAVKNILPKDDDKLQKLIEILNTYPIKEKKILIFSAFESTVRYLYENLKNEFDKVDYVVGGEKLVTKIKRFAPKANNIKISPDEEIQILISTEVLSEGLNLQDAQVVINYELHWNPVRIIQRVGRIDRIGSLHKEIYIYNFFPEIEAEKHLKVQQKVEKRIQEIIKNFGYDEKTIGLNEKIVRKKLFEIYTEKLEGLEEIEERSDSKYFELEFKKLIDKYPEEYKKALELPNMVNITKKGEIEGMVVFCRAGNWYKLRMVDENGDIIKDDDWEILKIIKCDVKEIGDKINVDKFEIVEKTRTVFESDANKREQEKQNYISPIKNEFKRFIEREKRKEPESIKRKLNEILNFVMDKELDFSKVREIRNSIKDYNKKYGLKKEEKIRQLEIKINELLKNAPPKEKIEIEPQYAEVIIVEDIIK
jgi:superfamily II DNA/RNA helicase